MRVFAVLICTFVLGCATSGTIDKDAGAWSWGDPVGIFIEPADENAREFTVYVVSEHA